MHTVKALFSQIMDFLPWKISLHHLGIRSPVRNVDRCT